MAALKILAVATMAVAAQGMELTKSNFQAEVKDSGKNAFVSTVVVDVSVCGCSGLRPTLPSALAALLLGLNVVARLLLCLLAD